MELVLEAKQKQMLSYKMLQSSKILQMASIELEQYINEQSLENPVIELSEKEPEDADTGELEKYQWICAHDEQNRYLYQKLEATDDELPEWNIEETKEETLSEYLWSQLLLDQCSSEQEKVLRFLLDSLDVRGYFTDNVEEVATRFGVSLVEVEELLAHIQQLEPAGVGARSLSECLCIQAERQGVLTLPLQCVIEYYLEELAKNQLPNIAEVMHLSLQEVKEFSEIIRALDPRPGALFSEVRQPSYVIPDVIIVKFKEHLDILLNESRYPDITLNGEYVKMCKEQKDKELTQYLLEKIHQAEWIQQCIAQRNTTLLSVVTSIVNMQKEFFLYGKDLLKPLRHVDVSKVLGIHESTVSRAINEKYLQCTWGMFPLSYFFAKVGVNVKRVLKDIVLAEDKKKPYSDRVLGDMLTAQGISISRRTVAKYRDELGIPGTTGRKEHI